jgi:hypothetical protein
MQLTASGFYKELFLSYVLLFGRDDAKTGEIAISKGELPPNFVHWLQKSYRQEPNILALQTFVFYRTRLRVVQETLKDWRPRRFGQLALRPYHDPIGYYGFWVVIAFGCIGLLGLAASLAQAVASFRSPSITVLVHSNGTAGGI